MYIFKISTDLFKKLIVDNRGLVEQQNGKFFSAVSSGNTIAMYTVLQKVTKVFEDKVSIFMPIGVIDLFKVINIHHSHAYMSGFEGFCQHAIGGFHEMSPGIDAGQIIIVIVMFGL